MTAARSIEDEAKVTFLQILPYAWVIGLMLVLLFYFSLIDIGMGLGGPARGRPIRVLNTLFLKQGSQGTFVLSRFKLTKVL